MIAPLCACARTKKHGKDRYGNQRFRCLDCGKTWVEDQRKPLGAMRTDLDRACFAVSLLLEALSIRGVERLTGLHRDTLCSLVLTVGQNCKRFLSQTIKGVPVTNVQCDELWSFVHCKQKTARLNGLGNECGDAWTFVGLEQHTKLILAWHVGKRTALDCWEFVDNLKQATKGRFQVSTDGFASYAEAIPLVFEFDIDFGQLIKKFHGPSSEAYAHKRYSPSAIIGIEKTKGCGNPDEDLICTSHVERVNLSFRMAIRRFTRLTNAFSKSWEHHEAMIALFIAHYNFCRKHASLKTTPAVSSELTDHAWTLEELLTNSAATL